MAIKAMIFDIDGVLADSRAAVAHNTGQLMREFGFDVPYARVEEMSSAHSADSVLIALAPELAKDKAKLKAMLGRLRELTVENLGMVKPAPLAFHLQEFAARYKLAAASNRKSSAHLVLHHIGIERHFGAVMTSEDAPVKPDPAMILMALERLGVRADEAVFVGDNLEDRVAGEAAGVRTIMLDGRDGERVAAFVKEFLG
jgi:HAD superfamily hydrolase (TIGR01549 family)